MNRLRRFGRQTEHTEDDDAMTVLDTPDVRHDDVEMRSPDDALAHPNGHSLDDFEPQAQAPVQAQVQAPTEAAVEELGAHNLVAEADEPEELAEPAEAGALEAAEPEPVAVMDSGDMLTGDATVAADLDDTQMSEVEGQTAPLPASAASEREELTPLPANAVVATRYVVQSQLHHSADRNLYRVAPRRQQKCPSCGRLSAADADACEHCEGGLSNQPPAEFYLMAESFYPQALMQDPALMDLRLYHPNLVPVVDFFSYTPFGRERYYAVAEPRQGVRLSQLSMPRPGLQVLGWALQLADVLDYLHNSGVVGAGAEADDILVQGDMASLASLQNAQAAPEDEQARTTLQSTDIAKLAATMYEAYTGHQAMMSPEGILPMPSQAPVKVGSAFRAAIEPMQGISPHITAGQWRDMLSAALLSVAELEQPGRPVDFVSASMSDVGRLRDQNQDSFCVTEFGQSSVERPMRLGLYVVADGMGGHKGGEVASAIAAQVFASEVMARVLAPLSASTSTRPALSNEAILQGMARAVQTANERIHKARDSRQNDMGTTLVAALIAGGKAYIINVGDSRLYFYTRREQEQDTATHQNIDATAPLAQGTKPLDLTTSLEDAVEAATSGKLVEPTSDYMLTQVSVDHSLVNRLVELGQLDPEEAKVHPHRNFIYRSLGGTPPVEVDTFVRTLRPGDRLLLCSDGLNSMIEDEAVEAVLATEQDPSAACERLIELANEAGGHDNITTIVVDVTGYLPMPEHGLRDE